MSGILPGIIFPNDIRIVQSRLGGAVIGVQKTVDGCAQLDPAVKTAWAAKKADIDTYVATDVSIFTNTTANFFERGLALEKELDAWQAKLEDAGCSPKSPRFVPGPPDDPRADYLKWIVVAVVTVSGAYAISRVIPIVGALRSPTASTKTLSRTRVIRRPDGSVKRLQRKEYA